VSGPTPSSFPSAVVLRDGELVNSCLRGETSAWSNLYLAQHAALVSSIRAFLGRFGSDANLVDEIAARVWYALVQNDFALLSRFDVQRGCRLSTFLSVLAKAEARLLLRSERRRRVREQAASRSESGQRDADGTEVMLSEKEFVETLSPAERTFYEDVLASPVAASSSARYSKTNLWQLRHRVRKKLEDFISDLG
jgi:DNA-directed RNA polymerase specialized sigma24 family protein